MITIKLFLDELEIRRQEKMKLSGNRQRQNWSGRRLEAVEASWKLSNLLGKAGVLPNSTNRAFRYLGACTNSDQSGGPRGHRVKLVNRGRLRCDRISVMVRVVNLGNCWAEAIRSPLRPSSNPSSRPSDIRKSNSLFTRYETNLLPCL